MWSMTVVSQPTEFLHKLGALISAPLFALHARASIFIVGFVVGYIPARLLLGDEGDLEATAVCNAVRLRHMSRCVLARVVYFLLE